MISVTESTTDLLWKGEKMNIRGMNYRVTFRRYDTDTFSTNICVAKNEDEVREYYSKYCDLSVRPASNSEYDEAKRKGMPIVII